MSESVFPAPLAPVTTEEPLPLLLEQSAFSDEEITALLQDPTHPEGDALYDYHTGVLPDGRRHELSLHLNECPLCQKRLKEMHLLLAQSLSEETRDPAPPLPDPGGAAKPSLRNPGKETSVLQRYRSFLEKLTVEAHQDALRHLRQRVSTFADTIWAGHGWLFVLDETRETLVSHIHYNVPPGLSLSLKERSIVGYAHARGKSYCTGSAITDAYYRPVIEGIHSAIAVPIPSPAGGPAPPLGVLHYESVAENAFTPANRRDMEAFATELVPYLMILLRAEREQQRPPEDRMGVFNPFRCGWSLEGIYHEMLNELAEGWETEPVPSLALWNIDWAKGQFWTVAARSYGSEFLRDKVLRPESFLGQSVARQPAGTVVWTDPDSFSHNGEKARRMGIKDVAYAPIHSPDAGGDRADGVLAFYFHHPVPPPSRTFDCFLAAIAEHVSRWVSDLHQQRIELAVASLRRKLGQGPDCLDDGLSTIIEAFKSILDVERISLFAREEGGDLLYAVATSGLEKPDRVHLVSSLTVPGNSPELDHLHYVLSQERDRSFTAWLGTHPGVCIRKNDVYEANDPSLPADFPAAPLNKYRESGAVSCTERRRFLGASVSKGADVMGVIRLIRSETSKPFRASDERLLLCLANELLPVFEHWRRTFIAPSVRSGAPSLPGPASAGQLQGPVSPLPALPRPLVVQVLQNVRSHFQVRGNVTPYFHEVQHLKEGTVLKLYAGSPGRELFPQTLPIRTDNDPARQAFQQLQEGAVLTSRNVPLSCLFATQDQGGRLSFACVPVNAWDGYTRIEGLLSTVALTDVVWSPEDLQVLCHASHRLGAIFSGRQGLPASESGGWVRSLVHYGERSQDILQARWTELHLKEGEQVVRVQECGRKDHSPEEWVRLDEFMRRDLVPRQHRNSQRIPLAGQYGLRISRDGSCGRLDLRFGPLLVGELDWGPIRPDFWDRVSQLIEELSALWADLLLGLPQAWKVELHREVRRAQFSVWRPILRWVESPTVGVVATPTRPSFPGRA